MFQFPGLARACLCIQQAVSRITGGLPHSDIDGSQSACLSPSLIAAYHVLRRHLVPRHPPCALSSLTNTFEDSKSVRSPIPGVSPARLTRAKRPSSPILPRLTLNLRTCRLPMARKKTGSKFNIQVQRRTINHPNNLNTLLAQDLQTRVWRLTHYGVVKEQTDLMFNIQCSTLNVQVEN